MTDQELCSMALEARELSYSPYSDITVGAALLTGSGKVYLGANIENASFTPTVCAERTAIFRALLDGERDFVKLAIAGGRRGEPPRGLFPPCGVCRQVMAEFCPPTLEVLLVGDDEVKTLSLSELLPFGFTKDNF